MVQGTTVPSGIFLTQIPVFLCIPPRPNGRDVTPTFVVAGDDINGAERVTRSAKATFKTKKHFSTLNSKSLFFSFFFLLFSF